jgi:hypothetical protein
MMVHSYLKLPEGYQQKKHTCMVYSPTFTHGDFLKYPETLTR